MKPVSPSDPATVSAYRVLGVLGGGGMGRVYLAQSRAGRKVAIKVIRSELAEDPAFRRRFAREVAAIRAVSPLFTAAVVDADTEAERPWVATTFIEGPSLEEWVAEAGPLSPGAVLTLAAGLSEALASIHAAGLVHRDLKPGNVLLNDAGPHIIDFGIALPREGSPTTTSLAVGTPSYMSPERIAGETAGPAGDVFALGATLFYAATGQPLVKDGTMYAQVMQISMGRFDLSGAPRELRPLIVRCISARPKDRPTAEELARILVGSGVAAPSPGWHRGQSPAVAVAAPRGPLFTRRRVLTLSGATVLGGAAVAAGWSYLDRRNDPPAPGTILWQLKSGARPGDDANTWVLVDRGERVIATNGAEVYALDLRGQRLWAWPQPAGVVGLRQWDDAVLVTDSSQASLLDAATGTKRFAIDEGVRRIALSRERAYLELVTGTVAVDRQGRELWRLPAQLPHVAGSGALVTHELDGTTVHIGLYDAGTGTRRWGREYTLGPPLEDRGGPPPDGGGGPDGGPGPPPPGGGRGGPPGRGPSQEEASWRRYEGRLGETHLVLRDQHEVRGLHLSNGETAWTYASPMPVAGIEVVGDLVLVAANQLIALRLATGQPIWRSAPRGARLATAVDSSAIIVAGEQGIGAIDLGGGRARWHMPWPAGLAGVMPVRAATHGTEAYVTFRPAPPEQFALPADVIAVAIG